MMDLPVAISWEMEQQKKEKQANEQEKEVENLQNEENTDGTSRDSREGGIKVNETTINDLIFKDPISYFAEIGGYTDSDMWWEHHFEQRYIAKSAHEHFEAVMLMMSSLRSENIPSVLEEERHLISFQRYLKRTAPQV